MLLYCRQRFELQFEILSGPHDTGPRKSETLHDTPPGPPESHYLLSSPGKPVSLRDSLKNSCLCDEQRSLVFRSLHALPSYQLLFQGASWSLRDRGNSDTTDKQSSWQGFPRNGSSIPFQRLAPDAHEYCSNDPEYASEAPRIRQTSRRSPPSCS